MEQFISGESKKIFRISSHTLLIGLTVRWESMLGRRRRRYKEDSSTLLILQEQLCISELFKDIQDAILLILHYRTILLFRATSLPVHISCRMCNQFAFYHQFLINTWRSKFEQKTNSILSACGSHGQKP